MHIQTCAGAEILEGTLPPGSKMHEVILPDEIPNKVKLPIEAALDDQNYAKVRPLKGPEIAILRIPGIEGNGNFPVDTWMITYPVTDKSYDQWRIPAVGPGEASVEHVTENESGKSFSFDHGYAALTLGELAKKIRDAEVVERRQKELVVDPVWGTIAYFRL